MTTSTDFTAGGDTTHALAGWQTAGSCLAVAAAATLHGIGTLVGAVLFAPVIHALVRLRRHAPDAVSTPGLVGSTLGPRAATFTKVTQITGYALLTVSGAQGIGIALVPKDVSDDPFTPLAFDPWLWSLYAVAIIVIAAVLTFALSSRVIASIAAVLAAAGLLICFYYALAVIARVIAGTVPEFVGGYQPPTPLSTSSTLVLLAVGLVGFEVITVRRARRGSSTGWPMGLAVAAVTICAVVAWWANQATQMSQSPWDALYLAGVVDDLYGSVGSALFAVGAGMFTLAGVLTLFWGIAQLTSDRAFIVVVAGMAAFPVVLNLLSLTPGYVGAYVLLAMYAAVLAANSRIPEDSVITWWLRIVMPIVLVAIILLPLLDAGFSFSSLRAVIFAAGVLAVAAAVALAGSPSAAD